MMSCAGSILTENLTSALRAIAGYAGLTRTEEDAAATDARIAVLVKYARDPDNEGAPKGFALGDVTLQLAVLKQSPHEVRVRVFSEKAETLYRIDTVLDLAGEYRFTS